MLPLSLSLCLWVDVSSSPRGPPSFSLPQAWELEPLQAGHGRTDRRQSCKGSMASSSTLLCLLMTRSWSRRSRAWLHGQREARQRIHGELQYTAALTYDRPLEGCVYADRAGGGSRANTQCKSRGTDESREAARMFSVGSSAEMGCILGVKAVANARQQLKAREAGMWARGHGAPRTGMAGRSRPWDEMMHAGVRVQRAADHQHWLAMG
ncbi:hypothetical protein L7F22_045419 [Adiantum nelumboides]|nr:hypothetical protein [Adiantum nelumboides]